jgi:hypothetical protein
MLRVKHYVNSAAVSMIPIALFNNIQNCIADILRDGISGHLIEARVWRGGATIFMRGVLKSVPVIGFLYDVPSQFVRWFGRSATKLCGLRADGRAGAILKGLV